MEKEESQALLERYFSGQATPGDLMLLENWYLHLHEGQPMAVSAADRVADIKKIKDALDARFKPARPVMARLYPRLAIAASVLCVIGTGLYRLTPEETVVPLPPAPAARTGQILPGGSRAVLTLADGRRIDLWGNREGLLAIQGGSRVIRKAGGELSYTPGGSGAVQYNRISTPGGGVYRVVLADGSRVWLNAVSTLTYPTAFTSLKERLVKLSGEAYFEVRRNTALPFRVITGTQSVRVLGTHFNINAYAQGKAAAAIRTTLISGSISLDEKTVLKPGEQALHTGALTRVSRVDTVKVVGWKNGYFRFSKQEDFKTAMQEIARWYNVEIVYPAWKLPQTELTGKIPRDSELSIVLNAIVQSTQGIHFKIEGRRVMVTK